MVILLGGKEKEIKDFFSLKAVTRIKLGDL